MNSIRVLHLTTHLGGGLGTAISSYIANSELDHSVLELEKSINPCTDQFNLTVKTLEQKNELSKLILNFDILLIHYYCHPLIVWALLEINQTANNKIVVWCHNNGKDFLHPLSDNLNDTADLVILSGCKDDRFIECDIIRPSPISKLLNEVAINLLTVNNNNIPSFRYIGSLDESKIHVCATEWFNYLSVNWEFDIATLDLNHNFSQFKVLIGETRRIALYDHFFCLVYPLKETHYGCGELGLQELLMLGYPVIIRRNSVETEIVENLTGVYFADSLNELQAVCSEIVINWNSMIESWFARSVENMKIINLRKPYQRLDFELAKIFNRPLVRQKYNTTMDSINIIKFAYNQKNDDGLKKILNHWEQTKAGKFPTKGSPAQFLKYFPALQDFIISNSNSQYYKGQ